MSAEALCSWTGLLFTKNVNKLDRPRMFWQQPKGVSPSGWGNRLRSNDTFPSDWIKVVFWITWSRISFLFSQNHAYNITVSLKPTYLPEVKNSGFNLKKKTNQNKTNQNQHFISNILFPKTFGNNSSSVDFSSSLVLGYWTNLKLQMFGTISTQHFINSSSDEKCSLSNTHVSSWPSL